MREDGQKYGEEEGRTEGIDRNFLLTAYCTSPKYEREEMLKILEEGKGEVMNLYTGQAKGKSRRAEHAIRSCFLFPPR